MLPVIETYSGGFFDYEDPLEEQVSIEDIARALSNISRFGGHIRRHYSVAQHALLTRELVIEDGYPELGYAALHHDSHEAYVGDAPSPLKIVLGESYRSVTQRVDRAVAAALGLDPEEFHHPVIKRADQLAMRIEATALKAHDGRSFAEYCGFEPLDPRECRLRCPAMPPESARRRFLDAHRREQEAR